jgi:FkbM family methyltransferase
VINSDPDQWIREQFDPGYMGYAVEAGAYDGHQGSHTITLERAGWKVLCVEADPHVEEAIKQWRQNYWIGAVSNFTGKAKFHIHTDLPGAYSSLDPTPKHPTWRAAETAKWEEVEVEVKTLDALLEEFQFPQLDFACIDTEGTELDVLKGLDLARWNVKALMVESWHLESPVVDYLSERGYRRVLRDSVNDFFLKNSV